MSIYKTWSQKAYTKEGSADAALWNDYLPREQKIYEYIISEKLNELTGTISELSKKFDMPEDYIVGFLDGISEAIPESYDMESLTSDSEIKITFDYERLYKKMVEYKAEHLSSLPEWDNVFDAEKRKSLYTEQKKSKTIVKSDKIGRNDPCICGSGKKYKHCCGA